MDLDKALVAAILQAGPTALEKALAMGISVNRLHGEGRAAFELIQESLAKHGSLPSVDFAEGKTGVTLENILLEPSADPVSALIDEVNNRHLHMKIQAGIKEIIEHQESRKPGAAYLALEKLAVDLRAEQIGNTNVEKLFGLGAEVRAFYDRIKAGERGVLTPWPSINDATLGFWPEDLILFVARVGVGKTWTGVMLALHAWLNPKPKTGVPQRVLFITTEVSRMRIAMRFYAMKEKLPYGEFTHGRMSFLAEKRFYDSINNLQSADGLYIIGGDFDFQIESVASAIETCKPDLVILDGVYLLRVQGANRTERMANAFDEVKRLAKRKKVPIVITTQFNREVKKDIAKTVGVESIALSDVGGWNADLIFGLIQTTEMREAKEMIFKPLKVREGEGKEVACRWDFEKMDFSELNDQGGGGGDADEKGTNLGAMEDSPADEDLPF